MNDYQGFKNISAPWKLNIIADNYTNDSSHGHTKILWHADPLLGGDREVGDCTAALPGSSLQTTTDE
jgi:hypothetical protein